MLAFAAKVRDAVMMLRIAGSSEARGCRSQVANRSASEEKSATPEDAADKSREETPVGAGASGSICSTTELAEEAGFEPATKALTVPCATAAPLSNEVGRCHRASSADTSASKLAAPTRSRSVPHAPGDVPVTEAIFPKTVSVENAVTSSWSPPALAWSLDIPVSCDGPRTDRAPCSGPEFELLVTAAPRDWGATSGAAVTLSAPLGVSAVRSEMEGSALLMLRTAL
jgi:hypothetical protein